ncbi:MGMT family protein [Halomarina halobia]|uniref:MGMT family protein n=1 Tax=Halomarina halobia TaxID=3033386 RepID=A0ABD6ABA6_9EURY|nr:MGMT family protein [Halomarina sp. PSR21]
MNDVSGIFARESEYLGRYVQLGVASDRVISVSFPRSPEDDAESEHPLLERVIAYLEGERDDFGDVTVALTVPTDQRKVLEATRSIPYGEQVPVERLARMTAGLDGDDEDAHGVVRDALASNPAPLLIPDHRVRDGPSAAPPEVEQRLRSLEGL